MKNRWFAVICLIISTAMTADEPFHAVAREKARDFLDLAIRMRRELHRIPEPCFQEKETAAVILEYLREWKVHRISRVGETGIKAVVRGASDGRVVAIRADMDGLPIAEATDLTYSSRNENMMHACGHDVHMANALLSMKILIAMQDVLPGTVVFIFQPCEEGTSGGGPSGAPTLIEKGVLNDPDVERIIGLHLMPGYPVGSVALRPGPLMANVASVFISIHGEAAHGAYPHRGIDAIVAASAAVMQFQSIISRMKDPASPAVLSIGKINGGVRLNVIAEEVLLEGTVRTFSFEVQEMIRRSIRNVLNGVASVYGVTSEFQFIQEAQFVKNDPGLTRRGVDLFRRLLGSTNVSIIDPVTVGEDFAFYSHRIPALFFFLGTGDSGELHSSSFAPDDAVLEYGGWLLACLAREFLDGES